MEATLYSPTCSPAWEAEGPYRALIDLCSAARETHDPNAFLTRLCGAVAETFGINDVMVHVLDVRGRLALAAQAGEPAPVSSWPAEAAPALIDRRAPHLWLVGEKAVGENGTAGPGGGQGDEAAGPGDSGDRAAGNAVGHLGRPAWARAGLALALDGAVVGTLALAVRGEEGEFTADLLPALAPFAQLAAAIVQRLREVEAGKRRAQRLAALEHVSAAGVTQANLDAFLCDACDTLLGVTGMDVAAVALFDPAVEMLQMRVVRGCPPTVPAFYERFSLGERLAGQAARDRRLCVHRALQQDESPEARVAREAGLDTAVCMPLWLRDQMLGVLFLATTAPCELESEEIDLIAAVAHQLSAAIANAGLLEQARRQMEEQRARSEELQVLHDVSRAMVATNSLEERLQEIARGLTRVTGTTHCAIFRREPDALAPWVCFGATEEQARRFHSLDMPPEEVKRLVRLMRSRKGPLPLAAGARDPFAKSEWLREQQIRGGLWLPFHLERRTIGAALCYRPGETPSFSPEQLRLAGAVATQGAIAIRMSQAYEHERNIAEALQQGLLPTVVKRLRHFELGSAYHPALQEARVGGDFYDVFPLSDDRVALLMADVSGKGLAAAKQTTMIKNMLRLIAFEGPEPASAIGRLNRAVCHFTEAELFVTAFYGVLSPDTGELVYANAGHDCPLWYQAAERLCNPLDTTGMALGMDPESCYLPRRFLLKPGDVLLLYTDGVTNAREGDRFFGEERLGETLVRFAGARPSRIVKYLYHEARAFSDSGLHDDVALLCLKAKEEG